MIKGNDDPIFLDDRQTYLRLLDSARNYARLLGKPLEHDPGRCFAEGIANLYNELNAIIGHDFRLNFEDSRAGLSFCVYRYHKWYDAYYFLPVKFIDGLEGRLKRIAVTFVHEFAKSNGLSDHFDDYHGESVVDHLRNCLTEKGLDDVDTKEVEKLIPLYEDSIFDHLLKGVKGRSYYKRLPDAIRRYKPANDYEAELIGLFKQGLQFIGRRKPSILNYGYDAQWEIESDWEPLQLEHLIRIVYDLHDVFAEEVRGYMQCTINESYTISPTSMLFLSPHTKKPLTPDDYPERFMQWFDDFINLIAEPEDDE